MKNQLVAQAAATSSEPPAGAQHILAASLSDMPDLAGPMLHLAGWLLLAVAVALLALHGFSRLKRKPPPGDSRPDQAPRFIDDARGEK